ncbi:MAG: SEC-C metal-binding domain-containing protein, partial [Clostridia bacterium]
EQVKAAGGLCILGTERHESRRIDNQLRGRSGRQGDPGKSTFFIALDDDLMRLFGGERIEKMVNSMGLPDDEPIEQKILTSAIENAQKKVEGRNYSIRKYVLQYDDVMNKQREIIYGQRKKVLDGEDLRDTIKGMIDEIIESAVNTYCNAQYPDDWNLDGLYEYVENLFVPKGTLRYTQEQFNDIDKNTVLEDLHRIADERYAAQEQLFGDNMREVERVIVLRAVDSHWMDHIDDMEQLKNGINLRAYGQHNPVDEYKFVGFDMFEEMIAAIREDTVKYIMNVRPRVQQIQRVQVAKPTVAVHGGDGTAQRPRPVQRKAVKVGRNDPCPCGSGKKYKNCCMAKDEEEAGSK